MSMDWLVSLRNTKAKCNSEQIAIPHSLFIDCYSNRRLGKWSARFDSNQGIALIHTDAIISTYKEYSGIFVNIHLVLFISTAGTQAW